MQSQNLADHLLLILSLHDHIHKSMILKEFRSLESFRKLLADGLLDHSGAGKPD